MLMTQAMRWFGPADPVSLRDIRQAGASEIVTALHEVPNGAVWSEPAITERRALIRAAGLNWRVVESLPVHEQIKVRGPEWAERIEAYKSSLRNLAACGIEVVTYNFMPLLDWTRTDLGWELPDGARALRFEWEAVAVYDIHMLKRPGSADDYSAAVRESARQRFAQMSAAERHALERTIIAGLPGSEESFTSAELLDAISSYADIDAAQLRANHYAFLEAVCPVADALGVKLVVHPDDPPFALFGLPRVVSSEEDLQALFKAVPAPSNGLCFCTGSLGVRRDNDLPAMIERLGHRIFFLHLRSVQREGHRSFNEAAHLEGDAEMASVIAAVHALSVKECRSIVMRPDHGHQMLDDLKKTTNPGYSLLGRMRGLAELRGLEHGIVHMTATASQATHIERAALSEADKPLSAHAGS